MALLLNELAPPSDRPARAYRFAAPPRGGQEGPPGAAVVTVPTADVTPGDYLVRVQVDGAESPLDIDDNGAHVGPMVSIT